MSRQRESLVRELFATAGIELGGSRPRDIRVLNPRFYDRLLAQGTLGAGESYMDGDWECDALDEMFEQVFSADLVRRLPRTWTLFRHLLVARLVNMQDRLRATKSARRHYDLSNDFYRLMLGETMAYTCGYWKDADNLDDAQRAKYDLVCRKLKLREGETLLDLGCGWGGLARRAAREYGARVTAVNVAQQQVAFAREWCAGLPVAVHLCDYRDHNGYNPAGIRFDKVSSVGMAEHVGPKNYRTWLKTVHGQLKPDGLFLLHCIGSDWSRVSCDPFTEKYIFPGSVLPSISQLGGASDGMFIWEDLHNFGPYYGPTAGAWRSNFRDHWGAIQEMDPVQFDAPFYRMWSLYLSAAMGMAPARDAQLWQIVLAPRGPRRQYESVR